MWCDVADDNDQPMIVALDVHYDQDAGSGRAAAVVFDGWEAGAAAQTLGYRHSNIAPYVPGQFVRRELPCILPLVDAVDARCSLCTIVVDGFVDLGPGRPGLGRHLFERLGARVEVVGVSKSQFAGAQGIAVTRGRSARPLWVTSTADVQRAADSVAMMRGPHRIPSLLKLADALSRGHTAPDRELAPP